MTAIRFVSSRNWSQTEGLDVVNMYRNTLAGMMSRPYMIGWHHCGMLQQWDESERGDVASNENGFMDPFENYYTQWTDAIQQVNGAAKELHAKSKE